MRSPIVIWLSALGPLWLAGAALGDGIKGYDRVVDLGQQQYTYITNFPKIDEAGNLVERKPFSGSDYQFERIQDRSRPGYFTGYSLNKTGDPTNLLPAAISGPEESVWGPNASGHIAGNLWGTGITPFFFAPEDGRLIWLKSLPGATGAVGIEGINALDQIVGEQGGKAIYYASPTSEPVELASLLTSKTGWEFDIASDINDRGEIIGSGDNPSGQLADFKLVPSAVPEPTTLALLALSGLALLARKCHRRR